MKITFLGTGAGMPSRTRNVSAAALQFAQTGAIWLFDCGEGTQHQVLRSSLRLSRLEKIFLTHLHGDHLFGLPGLLASRSLQQNADAALTVYGPAGAEEYIRCALDVSRTQLSYPVIVETVAPGPVCAADGFQVVCAPLAHRGESYGYAVIEEAQPGRFDAARALRLGIPAGPLYGRLKQGEAVTLPDGRTIGGVELIGPPRPGRRVVFCGDTTYTPAAVELARGADVLVHEATHGEAERTLAERTRHSTAAMAARVAREAAAGTLILTHVSPRYESAETAGADDLLSEARAIFPNTLLARDLWTYEIPRREPM